MSGRCRAHEWQLCDSENRRISRSERSYHNVDIGSCICEGLGGDCICHREWVGVWMMSGMTLVVSERAGVDESACVARETGIQSSVAARTRRLEGFRRRGEGG